jgi:hypothetical protein
VDAADDLRAPDRVEVGEVGVRDEAKRARRSGLGEARPREGGGPEGERDAAAERRDGAVHGVLLS